MNLKHAKKFCLLLLTVIVFGITGCVTHSPDQSTLQRMTLSDARNVLKSEVASGGLAASHEGHSYNGGLAKVITVLINERRIFLISEDREIRNLRFNKIGKVSTYNSVVAISRDDGSLLIELWPSRDSTEKVADAIYVLKEAAPEEIKKDESNFERAVQTYRYAAIKPEFTEEARRFKVLAEAAVRERRFGDAVGYYESALNITPWWPDGHFNSALVLGEIGDYETAAFEMKRYLRLEPNAPNARTVQDKIYEWESKVK